MTKWGLWQMLMLIIMVIFHLEYGCSVKIKNKLIVSNSKREKAKKLSYSRYFINNFFHLKKKWKKSGNDYFRIFRGSGTTCSYEWVESDDNIEVKIRLSPDASPGDIQYSLKNDYIYAKLKDKPQCLIEGKLKGFVDTNLSTWFLEKHEDYCILSIVLKKKHRGMSEWVGVVEKENILHISYDNASSTHDDKNSISQKSVEENELLHTEYFENAKYDDVNTFLLNWANKKSYNQNEFGIPVMKLKTIVMNNNYGIEILISGYDLKWEAEDSLVLKLSSFQNGIVLNIHRGKVASGIKGLHGNMVSYLVKDCEQRIIKKLQHDLKGIFYLNPTSKNVEKMMHTHSPQSNYSYITEEGGTPKHISIHNDNVKNSGEEEEQKRKNKTENINSSGNSEENSNSSGETYDSRIKEIQKDSPEEHLIVKELRINSKVKLTCDDKSKEPEFMKDWSEEKKVEFRRNSVLQLKANLELSQEQKLTLKLEDYINFMKTSFDLTEEESKMVWKKAAIKSDEQKNREKFYRFTEIENLTDKISLYNIDEYSNAYVRKEQGGTGHISDSNILKNSANKNDENNVDVTDSTSNEGREGKGTFIDLSPCSSGISDSSVSSYGGNISDSGTDNNINRRFFNCLEKELLDHSDKPKLTLYEIYMKSSEEEKNQMRGKWKINEMRLNTLIEELQYLEDDMIPTVCNNYRDVLLSDEYICLMKIRLQENPPKNSEEKRILQIVNSFVMSLYDDIKILMEHEEKEHLKKIQLICEKAVHDEKGLNDFIESMKPLLDYAFLGYIKHAIQIEKKNIKAQNRDFREHPSDWLIILMIIQKGIYSILEKDIWQDVINITTIICHEQPNVRKTILTTMLASMPKADWIFFKDIIKTLFKSVQEKKLTANHFPNFPHIPEAIFQLNFDIERILPDWFIREMLDEYDKSIVELMKSKKPLFWKMKETKWDKKFVQNFKEQQVQKYREYERNSRS
ncbi:CS domain protein [Plasmodium brasilianum]|uniref:NudC domain-containing protein 1 n=2 Tax=Plasmodium (Plasmodium) TaxID=418103 RepID=A0A1A8X240_PLAMA|nr:CS domain protein, putative [Plasmodium malariae]KAI4839436.1 CS domain protein [Plasmodium brasilianum]SBS99314.1 CS domain protein, putative [Plasmodium malariae]SBT87855.1 CS domain protein, putative [Plasmodium malariae]